MTAVNPKDQRPASVSLSWRLLARAFPRYFLVYVFSLSVVRFLFLVIPPVNAHALLPFRTGFVAAVVVVLHLSVLDPWLRRQIGLTAEVEGRERTWAKSGDLLAVANRQAFRFLSVSWPIQVLTMLVAAVVVAKVFLLFGLR